MGRFLHIIAIAALIGSALYAYGIKYDTILLSEQTANLRNELAREREAIAVLRAEWQFLNKPDRLQTLADRHLDLPQASVQQVVRWSDIPVRPASNDTIARKLEALGLGEPTNTPTLAKGDARTPATTGSLARKP